MYSFFVLGLIPGTNIQISFTMWVEATIALVLLAYLAHYHWKRSHDYQALPPTISADYDYSDTTVPAQ